MATPVAVNDALVMGEALVDFMPRAAGKQVRDVEEWKRCVGGAPANVAVGLARLGAKVAFCGCTGDDEFGHFLKGALAAEGIDVSALRQTPEGKTGIGFISLDARGERSFTFYRLHAAEYLVDARDVKPETIAQSKVLHLGTNSLLLPAARAAVAEAVRVAREAGRIVSCDPNLRLHLWKDPRELRAWLEVLIPQLTVLKLSEEEIEFVTGAVTAEAALEKISGPKLVVVTRGEKGALLRCGGQTVEVSAPSVQVVDTTGAGDGFMVGLLFLLTRWCSSAAEVEELTRTQLEQLGALGCQIGTRVVQHLGAVAGLPRRGEVPLPLV
jgi:fructokinase